MKPSEYFEQVVDLLDRADIHVFNAVQIDSQTDQTPVYFLKTKRSKITLIYCLHPTQRVVLKLAYIEHIDKDDNESHHWHVAFCLGLRPEIESDRIELSCAQEFAQLAHEAGWETHSFDGEVHTLEKNGYNIGWRAGEDISPDLLVDFVKSLWAQIVPLAQEGRFGPQFSTVFFTQQSFREPEARRLFWERFGPEKILMIAPEAQIDHLLK